MARIQGDALLMRHFLLRAKAIHKIDEASLVHWEAAFLIDAAMQRMAQGLRDIGAKRAFFEDAPALGTLAAQLALMLPELDCRTRLADRRATEDGHDVKIFWNAGDAGDRSIGGGSPAFSFVEFVKGCRVTQFQISIDVDQDGGYIVRYHQPVVAQLLASSPPLFQIVMRDYGIA